MYNTLVLTINFHYVWKLIMINSVVARHVNPQKSRCLLATYLLVCRQALGFNQAEFASVFGIKQSTYNSWEQTSDEDWLQRRLINPPGVRRTQPDSVEDRQESYWMRLAQYVPKRANDETRPAFQSRLSRFEDARLKVSSFVLQHEDQIDEAELVDDGSRSIDRSPYVFTDPNNGTALRDTFKVIHPEQLLTVLRQEVVQAESLSHLGTVVFPKMLPMALQRFITVMPDNRLAPDLSRGEIVMVTLDDHIQPVEGEVYLYQLGNDVQFGIARYGALGEPPSERPAWYLTAREWNSPPRRMDRLGRRLKLRGRVQRLGEIMATFLNDNEEHNDQEETPQ